MKNRTLAIAVLLCLTFFSYAQKDTCKVGIFINSVYDFQLDEKCFMADFWLWNIYKNDSLSFDNAMEVRNSKEYSFSNYSLEKKGLVNWAAQKCKAKIIHEWNVSCFPFDQQKLCLEIEDAQYDTTKLVYVADKENSKLDPSFGYNEWEIEKFEVTADQSTYATTYGNPELSGNSSYPKLVAEIVIRRSSSWILLTKMLTGAYVAFLISCLVFFLSSENQDSRFGLCVGGLFAAIGNKYIVESMVPTSTTNTLMDNVHNLTFAFILLIVLITIITLRLYESGDEKKVALSKKIDRISFYSIVTVFALANAVMIFFASR